MLSDYVYGPNIRSYTCFDAHFAERYGLAEAIIFNQIYFDFMQEYQQREFSKWKQDEGWMEEQGRSWSRYRETALFGRFAELFDQTLIQSAFAHLCAEGLLYLRPSVTEGYYWVSIGEESEGASCPK